MKKIVSWLKEFIREDFTWQIYTWFFLFTTVFFTFNYSVNFEDVYLDSFANSFIGSLYYFLWYGMAWTAILLPKIKLEDRGLLNNRKMWIAGLGAILILAITSNASLYPYLIKGGTLFDRYTRQKIVVYADDLVFTLIAIYLLAKSLKMDMTGFFGFKKGSGSLKPYFVILALSIPLLLWATTQDDFLRQYPNYRPWKYTGEHHLLAWGSAGYLLAYALDFLNVEFFFRGFMVIGMARYLGRHAILPMACLYGFLHFGKPMAEAISSIFGGYLLGVVAYRSNSILGGIIVHVGLAFGMELAATLKWLEVF